MLLAGGQGTRLGVLTEDMAKPAVPFGGKYRIIDFPISNCINSDIDTIGVLTQYRPFELHQYIGNGQPWDLDRLNGGIFVLPPYMRAKSGEWYKGTANAIYQNIDFIDRFNPDYVVLLSGDHIYKMNYDKMLDAHKRNEADCTIAVLNVSLEEAHRFGIMETDDTDRIVAFEEKPKKPKYKRVFDIFASLNIKNLNRAPNPYESIGMQGFRGTYEKFILKMGMPQGTYRIFISKF